MKNAQKPDHISLNTLINWLREGRFAVLDFQREFEWQPGDIRELMRSIFSDYYIGNLLLWKGKPENFDALDCEKIFASIGDYRPEYIVLDGQQRLTAINYALFQPDQPLPNRANPYFYYLNISEFLDQAADEAFGYDRLTKYWSALLDEPERQFEEHVFPLSTLGAGGWDFYDWVHRYKDYWQKKLKESEDAQDRESMALAERNVAGADEFGIYLKELTEEFQISYIELAEDIGVEKVCDIFTQINSRGLRLDVFDLINAMLKPKGLQLKLMWRQAAPRLEFVETTKMNVYVLQVMSILKQAYCSSKYLYYLLPGQEKLVRRSDNELEHIVLVQTPQEFDRLWTEAVDQLEETINLLRNPKEYGATSSRFMPYFSILPCFAAVREASKRLPVERRLSAERKIRKWYWASVFTNRYSGSVESTATRDYLDLTAWFENDDAEPIPVGEFAERLASLSLLTEIKSGTSIYNGIFNLFVVSGARDWISGEIPPYDDVDDHHIVPVSWAKDNIPDQPYHTILNRAPLTGETNRHVIGNRLPNEYLPDLIAANGEDKVRSILETHLISPAAFNLLLKPEFSSADFKAFVRERQRTILAAIENLLIKERLDLPQNLRDLDVKIEQVELALRDLIDTKLEADPAQIPGHVSEKVKARVDQAIRRSPGLAHIQNDGLKMMLEYADLRELQEIICNKGLWDRFEDVFAAKENLIGKLGQLAELRNGIRHSRSVSSVTQKEGEAAVIWFKELLD